MIANFVTFPWEGGNSRFTYLLDMFDCKNNEVELITSNFRHEAKKKRMLNENFRKLIYKVTLLEEIGYEKNVSIKRFISHHTLASNLKKYLKKEKIYLSI